MVAGDISCYAFPYLRWGTVRGWLVYEMDLRVAVIDTAEPQTVRDIP